MSDFEKYHIQIYQFPTLDSDDEEDYEQMNQELKVYKFTCLLKMRDI